MTSTTKETPTFSGIEAGQRVTIWAAQEALGAALQTVLQERCLVTISPMLPTVPPADGEVQILVSPGPAEMLCSALQRSEDPALTLPENLAETQEQISAVLGLHRRSRHGGQLLDMAAFRQAPGAVLAHFGLAADEAAQSLLQEAAGAAPDRVTLAVAQSRLQIDPALGRLAGEFDASRQALLPVAMEETLNAALLVSLDEEGMRQELELLRAQQRSMYRQMEVLYNEKLQLEQSGEQLRERLQARTDVQEAAGRRVAELEQVQAQMAQSLEDLQAERDRFYASHSYRLMAPLRGLRRILRGAG